MVLNAKVGKSVDSFASERCVLVMVETEETIRPEMMGLLDPDIDCYLLIHNDVERLDSLALALENENKKVRLARDFEELKQMRFLNHQLQQIAVKILK
ncbi:MULTISPECIES: hypothetical protein [Sphingobacterium]|jgi:hypothetical protein|uniref:Uncharacterized protein n=1 Tax=Sphingobacterium multivorum TaxID=28454 RepID=A0ABX7CVL7_SPHMU|nr:MULTISPECIES: hypothetical protein [Sphingobacterium]APU98070.1 hypothetical protein BV902_18440 [Sphingobacterium sp. B29]QQT28862.1 hypothetical protein I6I99_16040 [Sphingobacterium multivorum]QQT55109.1 hypothetical protein I6I98_07605 [Sphingobacterium multivorum]QRY60328.1 hypothetical protein JVX97_13120 [Sphingobacterium siyangense]